MSLTALLASAFDSIVDSGIVAVGGALAAVMLTALLAASASRRAARRDRYALMVGRLSAWSELPFRIRRRMSDDSQVVALLVDRMHDLQEQLVVDGAELAAECRWLAARWENALFEIRSATQPFITEAWSKPPIRDLAQMNLNGWGPTGLNSVVRGFRNELRYRFGCRRAINPVRRIWKYSKTRRTRQQVKKGSCRR